MSLLQAYLQNPRTRRTLSRKPGEKGFSLIELVVVIAVLLMGGSWRCWRLMHRLLRPRREGHSVRKRYGAGAKAR